jgi:tetratricopeptide (TPR) repeat protein
MPLNLTSMARGAQRLKAAAWLLAGRPAAAMDTWQAMLRRWPDDAHALASLAHTQAQAGHAALAIGHLQALVAAHPARSAADWFNLAYLLQEQDRLEEAEAAFRRALALDDRLDRAWYGLGLALIRLGRADEAAQALQRNTELQPMSPYGWYQLARVHAQQERPEQALRIIRHLQGFEPRVAAQLQRETGLAA